METIIRAISKKVNVAVARVIRTAMPEFGAGGQGFAIHDPEVDDMSAPTISRVIFTLYVSVTERLSGEAELALELK